MPSKPDRTLRQLHDDVAARQYYQRNPQPIAESISRLLARKGYAQLESTRERDEAWQQAVGPQLAAQSCPSGVRRGVLEVVVCNSAVLQELTFHKRRLLKDLVAAVPDLRIRDIRFRVGALG